ncbi:MAG: COQ9 family protein [Rhodospirillales bacterium]|jgi:ubiquinone biosynthesis protein COQ9|nr:COQ9 family protein [Rhodospirillales bacterium]
MAQRQTRDEILLAALPHVVFDGWTARALAAGGADAGLTPDAALRAFPGGMVELAEHFSEYADRRMTAELERRAEIGPSVGHGIALAVRLRLDGLAPHREAVRRSIAFLALPHNANAAARCAWRTVDTIWHAIGDRSVDFSYYTKRAALGCVYAATVLYWLGDDSEDHADTWSFLERRIEGARVLSGLNPMSIVERISRLGRQAGPGAVRARRT